jgi:hypothetical protein
MRIEGIGVISKNKALSILTKEGREAVKSGEITIDELGEMYKLELVKNPTLFDLADQEAINEYNKMWDQVANWP